MRAAVATTVAVVLALALPTHAVSAQDEPAGDLVVLDAHIEGSGPWTAWFGGSPSRTLVVVVANQGAAPVESPSLQLAFGRGGEPTGSLQSPPIDRLDPGEIATARIELDLPRFAVGTYAVEGTVTGTDPAVRFRAETSHIPWVVVVLPLAALIQLGLLWVRNRVRDRIHPVIDLRPIAEPTPPEPARADLETIVHEELDAVFEDAFARHDEELDDAALTELVIELAHTAGRRVAHRADLDEHEREEVDAGLTEALLSAFDLAPPDAPKVSSEDRPVPQR